MKKASLTLYAAYLASPLSALAMSAAERTCRGAGGNWSAADGGKCVDGGRELGSFIGAGVNVLLFLAAAIAVLIIIIGGIRYIISTGDAARIKQAKDTIFYAIMGLIVAILAYAIVNFVIGI